MVENEITEVSEPIHTYKIIINPVY